MQPTVPELQQLLGSRWILWWQMCYAYPLKLREVSEQPVVESISPGALVDITSMPSHTPTVLDCVQAPSWP